ncbi:glutathione S-transferase family protein [Stigmatella sp. ncwal1]|uniref:Glutathione S-transferase family protein n=1 Tax=Stigmatella ashevillensis TaxID=2995309 RepID=A0ABT5DFI2_9BACT|nr:glutathione S-transferase family protein [Stigmatella ashevillena]MDC0712421.1 glutathione S-transferase family protein [Stigmatella ashevillena]
MKLYFFQQSRATRVRWMLEELGIPYELAPVDMMKGEHKQPAYLKVHPMGSLPAIDDNGFSLFESAAIMMQLADKHPEKRLAPAVGTNERGEYYQWILFAMTEVEQPISIIAQHTLFLPEAERSTDALARASKRFKAVAAVLEERLKGRDFILGDTFSAADVVLGGVLYFASRVGQLGEDTPTLKAYHARLMARPAAKKGYGG